MEFQGRSSGIQVLMPAPLNFIRSFKSDVPLKAECLKKVYAIHPPFKKGGLLARF